MSDITGFQRGQSVHPDSDEYATATNRDLREKPNAITLAVINK